MQPGALYGLAILCLCCFSDSRAGNLEKTIQLLIKELKIDLKEDSSSIRDEIANLRDDVSNLRDDMSNLRDSVSADRDNIIELKDSLVELREQLQELPYKNTMKTETDTETDLQESPLADGCNKSATMFRTIQDQLKNFQQNCPKDTSSHSQSHPIDVGGCIKSVTMFQTIQDQLKNFRQNCPKDVHPVDVGKPCNNATLPVAVDCSGRPDGVHVILTKRGKHFLAMCETGWLIIAHRYDGSVDFDQTWGDYKHGFGNVWKEHFIGMDNIVSVLLQKRYKARFELTTWENETGYAEYQTFDINDEKDKYRLNIDGYNGTAGDSMHWANHLRFTTRDSDNDNWNASNCALILGPFWHDGCGGGKIGSIFGTNPKGPTCKVASGCLTWTNWPKKLPGVGGNLYYSFKEVKLKIRPIKI